MAVPMSPYDPVGPRVEMNWFNAAWTLYKKQWTVWVGATLVTGLLYTLFLFAASVVTGVFSMYRTIITAAMSGNTSVLSNNTGYFPPYNSVGEYFAGITVFSFCGYALAIVIYGGMFRMAWEQISGQKISVSGSVVGLTETLRLLALAAITFIPYMICAYLCFLPALVLSGVLMFAPLLIVVKGVGPFQAITESGRMLGKHWAMAGLYILAAMSIAQTGPLLLLVGGLITTPLVIISTAVGMYRFVHWQPMQPAYAPTAPGAWPPSPGYGSGNAPYGQPPRGTWPPQPLDNQRQPYNQPPPYSGQPAYGQPPPYGQPAPGAHGQPPQPPYGQSHSPQGGSQWPQPPASPGPEEPPRS